MGEQVRRQPASLVSAAPSQARLFSKQAAGGNRFMSLSRSTRALPETPRREQSGGCCSRRRNTPGGKYDKHNCRERVRKRSNRFAFGGDGSFLQAAAVILLLRPLSPCPGAGPCAVPHGLCREPGEVIWKWSSIPRGGQSSGTHQGIFYK